MRNRGAGRVADNSACDSADRAKHHRARQSAERGIAAAMFARVRL